MLKDQEILTENTQFVDNEKDNLHKKENKEKYNITWQNCLAYLSKKLKSIVMQTWISKISLIELKEDIAVLQVKNEFTKNFIIQSHIKVIQEALKEATGCSYAIKIEVDEMQVREIKIDEIEAPRQNTLSDIKDNSQLIKDKSRINYNIDLSKTYQGSFNQNTLLFARTILQDTSGIYKSLFIQSASGLGKSHSLHMIANEYRKFNNSAKIKYINSESFINELIMAIQKNNTESFRQKYRKLDLLLFDDFHFLENKAKCQEEFIHTFENIVANNGKVIIASTKKLLDISKLNKKLMSLLRNSLTTEILEPNEYDQEKLLDFKLQELKINLSETHKKVINSIKSNCIREIEGNIMQLNALRQYSSTDSEAFAKAFECNFSPVSRGLSINKIIEETANYFFISEEDLIGKKRKEEFTKARHIAIYIAHNKLGLSYKKIGEHFSNRKHSSIIHSIKTIEDQLTSKLPSAKFTFNAIAEIERKSR